MNGLTSREQKLFNPETRITFYKYCNNLPEGYESC